MIPGALLLLSFALLGGGASYHPWAAPALLLLLGGLVAALPWVGRWAPVAIPAGALGLLGLLSAQMNPANDQAPGVLLIWAVAWLLLFLGAGLGADRLLAVAELTAWGWLLFRPLFWALSLGLGVYAKPESTNVYGLWAALFCLVVLARGRRWAALPFVWVLIESGSRGAFLGLLAGLWALYWPAIRIYISKGLLIALGPAVGLLGLGLWFIRPGSASVRIYYWYKAIRAGLGSPWVGLGPGGILDQQILNACHAYAGDIESMACDPGLGQLMGHAHNVIFQVWAELGGLGLLGLLLLLWWLIRYGGPAAWQVAALAALGAAALVGFPFYWPGLLFFTALVIGSVDCKNIKTPFFSKKPELKIARAFVRGLFRPFCNMN